MGRRAWWAPLGLLGLVLAAYGQTLAFDLVWDDHYLLVSGPALQARLGLKDLFASPQSAYYPQMHGADRVYRPVLALTARVDRAIWGLRPWGFHLSNILAHLTVVLVLWRLGWWLTGSRLAAFTAGALLAVHPSAVEPVASIGFRVDLFVALGIAAVLLLLRGSSGDGGVWRLGPAMLVFVLALASKETAAVIPATVTWAGWVYPRWFDETRHRPSRRSIWARLLPFWIVLVLYAVFRRAIIGSLVTVPVGPEDLPAQIPRALVGIATYAEMTLIPRPATGYISVEPPAGLADLRVIFGLAVVALLLLGLFRLRRMHPASSLVLGWYVAALVPASNLVPIYSKEVVHVAERSLYPALAGWCLLVAVGAHALRGAVWGMTPRFRTLGPAMGSAVLGTFLLVTAVKVTAWRDDVTLWTSAFAADPGSVLVRLKLAAALARTGNIEEADAVVQQARADFPADPRAAYLDGVIADLRGDLPRAYRQYQRAIALGATESLAFRQAAVMAVRFREWDEAGHWFTVAAARFPREAWPQVGLAWYHERRGRADLGQTHWARAAGLGPQASEPFVFQAQLLLVEGSRDRAVRALKNALLLDPASVPARRELALIAEREGQTGEAAIYWRGIVESLPAGTSQTEALDHLRRLGAAAPGNWPGGRP